MRLWRVEEAQRLVKSELARELAEAWARYGDEQCLADTPFEPELVGVGRWWLGPFTIGNRKMGEMPFFSLPPVSTCPGHTPFCLKWCYAIYEIANWRAHVREAAAYLLSLRDDFPDIAVRYLSRLPHPVVRLHVSGDFYDRRYLEKWAEAARRLPHKTFYTYTKSLRLIRGADIPKNLIIHLSADPFNYAEAAEVWRELRRGFITFVYTPGRDEELQALQHLLENTETTILLFLNHVQHAPRAKVDVAQLRRRLREKLGPAASRVVFDPEEFAGVPQCLQCKLCWIYRQPFK